MDTPPPPPPGRKRQAGWYRATEASAVGIEMAVAIAVGAIGGHYLEVHVTHWSPWTTLLGLAAGIGAAAQAVIRTVRKFKRNLEADRETQEQQDGRVRHHDEP